MPQMAPMMWLPLFLTFLLGLFCFTILNYFLLAHQKKTTVAAPILSSQKPWKW